MAQTVCHLIAARKFAAWMPRYLPNSRQRPVPKTEQDNAAHWGSYESPEVVGRAEEESNRTKYWRAMRNFALDYWGTTYKVTDYKSKNGHTVDLMCILKRCWSFDHEISENCITCFKMRSKVGKVVPNSNQEVNWLKRCPTEWEQVKMPSILKIERQ